MTKKASRQLVVLTAVMATVIVVVIARRGETPAGPAAAPSNSPQGAASATATTGTPVADVKLELLKSPQTELEPSTRNPFQFKPKAPPPAPPRAAVQAGDGAPVLAGPPPPPPGPPPPPPIVLKYIGVLDTAQGKMAIFRDSGGEIVNGKEGDIIDGRYRLLKIGVESADLAYVDGRGRQTIRLSGQ